jgi:hypothetical protein
MYCTECGKPGSSKFCGHCGTALGTGTELVAVPTDWSNEHRYEVLIHVPEVRERIARHASRAKASMTAEEFLQVGDKLLSPLMGGIPVGKLAAVAQPLYAKLGIRTGKRREQTLPQSIGQVLAAVLCALASAGLKIREVQQADDGCHLVAILPSDVFSFAGDVLIDLAKAGTATRLVLATNVPGQLYDWGKSHRYLNELLRETTVVLAGGIDGASNAA